MIQSGIPWETWVSGPARVLETALDIMAPPAEGETPGGDGETDPSAGPVQMSG